MVPPNTKSDFYTWWFIPRIVSGLVHPSYFCGRLAPTKIPLKSPGLFHPPKRFVGSSPPSREKPCILLADGWFVGRPWPEQNRPRVSPQGSRRRRASRSIGCLHNGCTAVNRWTEAEHPLGMSSIAMSTCHPPAEISDDKNDRNSHTLNEYLIEYIISLNVWNNNINNHPGRPWKKKTSVGGSCNMRTVSKTPSDCVRSTATVVC